MESQAPYRTLQPGEMLNWYRIERILGRGGFGVIYLATDTNLDHLVAIKEYIPSDVATRTQDSQVHPITEEHGDMFRWGMDRFIKEARNLVKFKHPNIVRVMSVFQENNTAYMVMEFEEGLDLRSFLRQPGANNEQSLRQLILPIINGLAEVHRHGFIHRDIKPANILVRKDGSPVLLDFGSARNASKYTQQSLTALVSVGYAPLEQYNSESDEQQGPWTDIYALGGTLYYAISGKDPVESTRRAAAIFNGGADPLINAEYLGEGKYTADFLRAIDWALQFGIADRPQSLNDWMPALLSGQSDANNAGGPMTRISALKPGVDTKAINELSDATVLSRERRSGKADRQRASSVNSPASSGDVSTGVRGLSLIALLLAAVALALWFTSNRKGDDNQNTAVAEAQTTSAEQKLQADLEAKLAEQQRIEQENAAERQRIALEEQRKADELALQRQAEKEAQAERDREAEEARLATEARAAEQAAIVAAEAKKRAEQEKADKARAEAAAASARAKQQAEAKAAREREAIRLEREAKRLAVARKERRLKQAISAAQNSLSVGDLSAAQRQLQNAQSIDANDPRVQTLAFAVQAAQAEYDKPVSDADFDTVTRMFDGLQRAIENKDPVALDRLAISSQQSTIFKSLMKNFERLDVSITGIRVRNVDKSITGTLRIESMVRANGDRGNLSDKYAISTITSRRVNGGWSKIEW